jgi:hypothetical protein
LYAEGKNLAPLGLADPLYPLSPTLPLGLAAAFNPLVAIESTVVGDAPAVTCNSSSPSLSRDPFNVDPVPGANMLDAGAAVAVAGDLSVENLSAEVLIGNV